MISTMHSLFSRATLPSQFNASPAVTRPADKSEASFRQLDALSDAQELQPALLLNSVVYPVPLQDITDKVQNQNPERPEPPCWEKSGTLIFRPLFSRAKAASRKKTKKARFSLLAEHETGIFDLSKRIFFASPPATNTLATS